MTLQREWQILDLIRPQKAQKLPDVLSHEEVQRLLQAVRLPHYSDVPDDDLLLWFETHRRDATSGDRSR